MNLDFESERPPQPHPEGSSWTALEPTSVHLWKQLPAGSPSSVDPAPRSGVLGNSEGSQRHLKRCTESLCIYEMCSAASADSTQPPALEPPEPTRPLPPHCPPRPHPFLKAQLSPHLQHNPIGLIMSLTVAQQSPGDGRCALGSQEAAAYFRKASSSLRPLDGPPSLWFPVLSPLAHSLCFCDS